MYLKLDFACQLILLLCFKEILGNPSTHQAPKCSILMFRHIKLLEGYENGLGYLPNINKTRFSSWVHWIHEGFKIYIFTSSKTQLCVLCSRMLVAIEVAACRKYKNAFNSFLEICLFLSTPAHTLNRNHLNIIDGCWNRPKECWKLWRSHPFANAAKKKTSDRNTRGSEIRSQEGNSFLYKLSYNKFSKEIFEKI